MSTAARIDLPDLSSLGIPDLQRLRAAVDARIEKLEKQQRAAAFRAVEDLAKRHGLSKGDLAARYNGAHAGERKRYRHPSNPALTWNGRGRRPQWLEEHLAKGGRLEELEMKG